MAATKRVWAMAMRKAIWFLAGSAAVAAAAFSAQRGVYGWTALARRGGSVWVETGRGDPRVSAAARAGMAGERADPGPVRWSARAGGFETAEMDIRIGSARDRMRLVRVDPARWAFSVHSRPAGDRGADEWRQALGATFVVNGSYFDRRGAPDTPLKSGGAALGPSDYAAAHGAFVADAAGARLVDLKDGDWRAAMAGASDAFVSYPMLIGADGRGRTAPSRWVSARSFVAQDSAGRIVIGTTEDAGLTLGALSDLLRRAPLDLTLALNLDGGPLACQAVDIGGLRRSHCGRGEHQMDGERVLTLRPGFEGKGWSLPVVLVVRPR
jgi:hypothetical protein